MGYQAFYKTFFGGSRGSEQRNKRPALFFVFGIVDNAAIAQFFQLVQTLYDFFVIEVFVLVFSVVFFLFTRIHDNPYSDSFTGALKGQILPRGRLRRA